ncbi:MAG: elongation factor P [Candidatus Moranbacteria bacterium]|jgi:elongation factor P|nr:elongation factor P [Candidatus Moranbacteria bacterium]
MLAINDIKVGSLILLEGEPCRVLFCQHSKTGRAGAVLRTKLKNIRTGAIVNQTFQGSDKFKEPDLESKRAQFLYKDENSCFFMDNQNYEQFEISNNLLGGGVKYLKEGTEIDVLYFNQNPISVNLPIKMEFKVVEAPPSIKGNTADGGSKQVVLETGAKIATPLFVKQGDIIRINTETGEYVERVK